MDKKPTDQDARSGIAPLPPGAARRAHAREAGFGWTVRMPSGALLAVLDLSAGGMRLDCASLRTALPEPGPISLDVLGADDAAIITGLECELVRSGRDGVAVRFLTPQADLAAGHLRFMAKAALAALRLPDTGS